VKIHKIVLTVIDFDGLGWQSVGDTIEDMRYPNDCIRPRIQSIETRDIGEWTDDHPLNRGGSAQAEIERLFGC
jgi:hypothetical protein